MFPSIIRTIVPFLVALVGPWVASNLGVGEDDLSNVATVVAGAVYYVIARLAERYFGPQLGWLLGHPAAPTYPAAEQVPFRSRLP